MRTRSRSWLNYRTIWRWHFYAGILCIPMVIWLSVTGSIYLFRPQIERWLDRPYDHLQETGAHATEQTEVYAALAAVPGTNLHDYELPRTAHSAVRVIVGRGANEFRVYVDPATLAILKVINEEHRPMRILFHLHGELLMGDRGSMVVELAASWAVVLILTGLYLWWPRDGRALAGVVYPRLGKKGRLFWRDLHAVTGIWVSFFALFLLFTGLPWAASWGGYLKAIREISGTRIVRQDWTTGSRSEAINRMAMNAGTMAGMSMEHDRGLAHLPDHGLDSRDFSPLHRLVPAVAALHLASPVLISPPLRSGGDWTARSDAADRPMRVNLVLDPRTGAVLQRQNFDQRPWLDRMVGIGVAAHEGQLFGLCNQLLGLFTACGLILICVSAVALWWRRRPEGVLGAPAAMDHHGWAVSLAITVLSLGVYFPLLGVSIVLIVLVERFVLQRLPSIRIWLGLPIR